MKRPGIRFRNVDHDKVTGTKYEQIQCVVWLAKLLIRAGDVEQNPGPKAPAKEAKPDKATIMANKVDAHDAKLGELEALVKAQAELIEEMKKQQVELTAQLEEKQVDLRDRLEANKVEVQTSMGQLKVALEDELRRTGSNLDHKITDFKVMPKLCVGCSPRPSCFFILILDLPIKFNRESWFLKSNQTNFYNFFFFKLPRF